jgi:hypothetical protein
MKRFLIALIALLAVAAFPVQAAPKAGDSFETWLKDATFKALYSQALANSPVNHKNSWIFKDMGLAPSEAIAGQNANTWVRLSTCASKVKLQCRLNHIQIFYDVANQEFFAFLSIGSHVGWMGATRSPTSLEQKFFTPYLTAKDIR